jgi:hypothetical protein
MKRLFLFCLSFLLISSSFSQDLINNFKQDDNKLIIWQNVFETELNKDQLNILITVVR